MTSSLGAALPALAALLEVCPSVQAALSAWPGEVDDEVIRPALTRVARRVSLGASLGSCLRPLEEAAGADGRALRAALQVNARHGGPAGPLVEGLAEALATDSTMRHQRQAAAAASRLSGRLMVLLAGAFVVLLPAWGRVSLGVLIGCALAAATLMFGGIRWMKRLTPEPIPDDPIAGFADLVRSLMAGGSPLYAAVSIAATAMNGSAIDDHLSRALARVRLGASLPRALALSGHPDLAAFARAVGRAQRLGTPLGAALYRFAADLRERRRRDFELRARRAAVMLVLPLTLCLLPAFTILIVVPLLRSLAA